MNNLSKYTHTAVVRMATAVLFIATILTPAYMKGSNKNASTTPDFAYPQTVEKNSDKNLTNALASQDWKSVVLAMIQKITASNLVSHENVTSSLNQLDSIIEIAPEQWKPIFQLMEADIYNSIYNSIRWEANQREIPIDSVPLNPYEWSREIFANKTLTLCTSILDNHTNDGKPLKEWTDFLADYDIAIKNGMTIDEFLAEKSVELLGNYSDQVKDVIPFFAIDQTPVTSTQKCRSLRDKALAYMIERTSELGQNMLLAQSLSQRVDFQPQSLRSKYLMSALDKVKGTEGEQIILQKLESIIAPDNANAESSCSLSKKQYVGLLQKSIKQFPKGIYVNALKNILANYVNPNVSIAYQSQYLTSSEIEMDVTMTNCNQTWILVYDYAKYARAKKSPTNAEIAENCKLMKAVKMSATGEAPFTEKATAEIGKLPIGTYIALPSSSPSYKSIYASIAKQTWHQPFTVSDISALTLNLLNGQTRVIVIDGSDGHPIEGATVKVYTRNGYASDRQLSSTLTTDKDGCVTVGEKNFEFEALYDSSTWESDIRIYNTAVKADTTVRENVTILPDRSIYHPGDSISVALIAYSYLNKEYKLDTDKRITIKFLDANGKTVATEESITDQFGRTNVSFQIPKEGLLGKWRITASSEGYKSNGTALIQVADYVAPTFFITADNNDEEVTEGEEVVLKGQVVTYSGMPVAGSTVNYTVQYRPPLRWWSSSSASYTSSVTTDAEGKYEIKLPTSNLKDTQYEKGIFNVQISATSPAGETQTGPTQRFAIGREYSLNAQSSKTKVEISDSIPDFKFIVEDMLGRKVQKELNYTLTNAVSGEICAEGKSMSPDVALPYSEYESAKYNLKVELAEEPEVNDEYSFVMWRKSDKAAPQGTTLWIPTTEYETKEGEKSIDVTIGSGIRDRWIPMVLSGDNKVIEFRWLHIDKDNLSIPAAVPSGRNEYQIIINYTSDLKQENGKIAIYGPEYRDNLEIITESFRDKISAGDEEHWKFRFEKQLGKVGEIPVMAVMTDAALNQLAPFQWNFNPTKYQSNTFAYFNGRRNVNQTMGFDLKNHKYLTWKGISFPDINNYGQQWGLFGYYGGEVIYITQTSSNGILTSAIPTATRGLMSEMKMAKAESADYADTMVLEESQVETVAGTSEQPSSNDNDIETELRDTECPVAFFMPYLTTGKDGVVDINFTVPNFNTTWQLQVLGYDENLQTAYKKLETVASKPVMVTTHAPRFVRTGDEIELTATLFNNTESRCALRGNLELVNLLTGKTIASKSFAAENVEAAGSRLISMKWTVLTDVSSVGYRAYAEGQGHRDGEQALLPVLPAYSPVTESTPFWLTPDQKSFEIELPKFKETDQVTLQYCDNPAWYCLTALPDLTETDSKSVIFKSVALYANSIAYHLISGNKSLKTGLETLLSDKNSQFAALTSNLEKDGNLKISKLNNTPWVNDAESETLRMSKLSSLLDSINAERVIKSQINDLMSLQTSKGGWSWCPGMEPSVFITHIVLNNLAMMQQSGALEKFNGTSSIIKKAISYVDNEILEQYKKYHKKNESLGYLLYWIYTRGCFDEDNVPNTDSSKEMSKLIEKALKDIATEWKDYDIRTKAEAAMVLWRNGKKENAQEILESLSQYASKTPEKGIWFDNLNSGYHGSSVLMTTTMVLKAFAEIEPTDKFVDGLRHWLILSRQTEDWGQNMMTTDVINTILTSGTDWTADTDTPTPKFSLKSNKVEIPETAALTGAFTVTLDPEKASGKKLKITRTGNSPAWGGVISQYEASLRDISAVEIPEMSIRKEVVALVDEGNGNLVAKSGIPLAKGMKVRVTLIIDTDRDMDYVAITEERSACLEPTEQLSHYTTTDGVWYYKEVRNENTNLYFNFLPKGHHVISYDCTVSQEGSFSCGIATMQSQYTPALVCHSRAQVIEVK